MPLVSVYQSARTQVNRGGKHKGSVTPRNNRNHCIIRGKKTQWTGFPVALNWRPWKCKWQECLEKCHRVRESFSGKKPAPNPWMFSALIWRDYLFCLLASFPLRKSSISHFQKPFTLLLIGCLYSDWLSCWRHLLTCCSCPAPWFGEQGSGWYLSNDIHVDTWYRAQKLWVLEFLECGTGTERNKEI